MVLSGSAVQAVIFDMDGLLIDSEPIWAEVESRFLKRHGCRYDEEVARQYLGMRITDALGVIGRHYGIAGSPEAFLAEWVETYLQLTAGGIPLRPGAAEAVEELHGHFRLAIASSSPRRLIQRVVELFHWQKAIAAIQSGEEVQRGKPAPDIFLAAARQLAAAPARCLVLEDSLNGVRAAKAAGMLCFAVPSLEFHSPDEFGEADGVFHDLHEVRQALLPGQ